MPRPLKLDGLVIEFCKTVKYLGIHLDTRLNWHHHIQTTARKCTNILFATEKMIGDRWGLSPDNIMWIYNTIIKPVITYACVTWAPRLFNSSTNMAPLEKLGNHTLRMATSAFGKTSQDALHYLFSILPIQLELEKSALLQAIRLKSLDHWPKLDIDHSTRPSFEPC